MRTMDIKVLICDELPLVRDGLRTLLESSQDLKVVGTADGALQTVHQVESVCPDVILVGLSAPEASMSLAQGLLTEPRNPADLSPHLVAFHGDWPDAVIAGLIRAGVRGLIHRRATSDAVIAAIKTVVSGRVVLSDMILDRVVDRFCQQETAQPRCTDPGIDLLTKRELEVVSLVGEGLSIEGVAAKLFIGVSTVRTHLHRIRQKLDLKDRTQVVAYAYRSGVVSQQQPFAMRR